jgi:lipopolysaccharide exporter
LFVPEDIGLAGVIQAIAGWVAVFGCLSYEQAIPLSTDASETRATVRLCLALATAIFLLTTLAVAVGAPFADAILGTIDARRLLWIVPLIVLLTSLARIGSFAASRAGRYGIVSVSSFVDANLTRVVLIGLGLFIGSSAIHVLLGGVLGLTAELGVTGCVLLPLMFLRDTPSRHESSILSVAKHHIQFPAVQLWNNVLNTSARSLPVFLLGVFFGAQIAGFYVFGYRLISMPVSILGQSLAQVFYPEASAEWNRTSSAANAMCSGMHLLTRLCVFPTLALALLGPLIFAVFFGANWHEAGVYAQILAPLIGIQLIASPLSSIFLIRGRAGLLLGYNVMLLLSQCAALLLGVWVGGPRLSLVALCACSSLIYFHLLLSALRQGGISPGPILKPVLRELGMSVATLWPACIAYWIIGSPALALVALSAGGVLYAYLLYRTEPAAKAMLRRLTGSGRGSANMPFGDGAKVTAAPSV